jgi:hypothetical protein
MANSRVPTWYSAKNKEVPDCNFGVPLVRWYANYRTLRGKGACWWDWPVLLKTFCEMWLHAWATQIFHRMLKIFNFYNNDIFGKFSVLGNCSWVLSGPLDLPKSRSKTYQQGWKKIGQAREHCSQEMLNSCRKLVWMKICYWKFEWNFNTHVPLWAQQHIWLTDIIPWIQNHGTIYVYAYAHVDLAQKYSVGLQ